jgi:hypothetical protein
MPIGILKDYLAFKKLLPRAQSYRCLADRVQVGAH